MKLIGEHWEGDVRVRWYEDNGEITIKRDQDVQNTIDLVAAINSEGAKTVDGLGKPLGEVPVVEAQKWAAKRGIPWEKLLYSNEYDDQLRAFLKEYPKLAYKNSKTVFTVQ